MIQENYLSINKYGGYGANKKWSPNEFEQITFAAQSIADGDLIDVDIRKSQQWSALPYHGVLSSLKPAQYVSKVGAKSGRIMFPLWLGKFSNRRKNDRLFSELAANMNSSQEIPNCGVTGTILTLDYLEILKDKIVRPLQRGNDAINDVVGFMKKYNISREDWDTVEGLGGFKGNKNKEITIATKTKTAFTKKCKTELSIINKQSGKKVKKGTVSDLKLRNAENENESDEDEDEDDDIGKDNMIKMTTRKGQTKGKTKKKATKTKTKKKSTTTASKKKPATKRTRRKKKTFDD